MKALFSKTWNKSKQARKQRKYRYNAPLHVRRKFLSAHLAKHLRKELGRRSAKVRQDDVVRIVRGKFAGKEGKVARLELRDARIFVEGVAQKKAGGKEAQISIDPSNVIIVELNLKDAKRVSALKKKKAGAQAETQKTEKAAQVPKAPKSEKKEAKEEKK